MLQFERGRLCSRATRWLASSLAAAVTAGCAMGGGEVRRDTGAIFYPPLPNSPRIQLLRTFTGERDMGPSQTGFSQFVLGDDPKSQHLMQPYGSGLYRGKLYVADSRVPGLAVFDLTHQRFFMVRGSGNGRLKKPINVTIDADGTKYVTDTGRDQVLVFDQEERFIHAFGTEGQFKPVDCAIAGDRLYVVDILHHQVHALDKRTGRVLFTFGGPGSNPGQLFHPTNIAIGPEGDVYVVETSNFRVQRFSPDGKTVRVYGEIGTSPGTFARPKGLAIDRQGRLYVADAAFENVQVFDNGGRLLLFFGQPGDRAEGLSLPTGVTIDYDNVELFRRYADPRFAVEYLILVSSQFGPNKVDVFGFGKMRGMDYPPGDGPAARATR